METTAVMVLPDEQDLKRELYAIAKFQALIRANLKEGTDYGVIPGTKKPTLLKPGAEKTTKLLGLADTYQVVQRVEEWDKPFFNYEIKCTLIKFGTDTIISEGLGSCNSWESKYRYRWVWPDDVPEGMDKTKLVKKVGNRKDGKGTFTQYRLDNEDIYSQVNTLLKMAEKRALVDAALHAGRLSELFTQDIEDGAVIDADYTVVEEPKAKPPKPQPVEDYYPPDPPHAKAAAETQKAATKPAPEATQAPMAPPQEETNGNLPIDGNWAIEKIKFLGEKDPDNWSREAVLARLNKATGKQTITVTHAISLLDKEQADTLAIGITAALKLWE